MSILFSGKSNLGGFGISTAGAGTGGTGGGSMTVASGAGGREIKVFSRTARDSLAGTAAFRLRTGAWLLAVKDEVGFAVDCSTLSASCLDS